VPADELLLTRSSQITRQHQQLLILRLHIDDVQIDQHGIDLNVKVLALVIALDVNGQPG
jgi:hypothetical protein